MIKPQSLSLDSSYAQLFSDYLEKPKQTEHLFVITHLGQLKQMEALIIKKNLISNGLIVLYTTANFVVPQTVHDKVTQHLFDFVAFVEIPFKINQINYFKLKVVYDTYVSLLDANKPKNLYLNSFEGHYAVLIDVAKKRKVKNILVEEGTATYKLNLLNNENFSENKNEYVFGVSEFMDTVGKTQIFKKIVKTKKNIKELSGQSKRFLLELWCSKPVQQQLISRLGGKALLSAFEPVRHFDKIYASHPELLDASFNGDMEYFLGALSWSNEEMQSAKLLTSKYEIKENDVIFLSQRYGLDANSYAMAVCNILDNITHQNQQIFIKLHPKEDMTTWNAFQQAIQQYKNRFLLINESDFLIEPLLHTSGVKTVIGLTSSTLIYIPLLFDDVRSISIATLLIDAMENSQVGNTKALATLKEHLAIIHLFEKVEIL